MGNIIHVVIITLIAGIIVFIVMRAGGKKKEEDGETAPDSSRGMRNIAITAVFAVILVSAGAGGMYYYNKSRTPAAPPPPANVAGEKSVKPEFAIELQELPGQPGGASPQMPNALTERNAQTINALYQRIRPSVVVIYVEKDRGRGSGSGFFVNHNGDIITSHHVLRGATAAKVKTANGAEYEIQSILAEDVASDVVMASVKMNRGEVVPLQVSSSQPEIGERVVVVGSPLGFDQSVTDGIVSAIRMTKEGNGKYLQVTAPISPGSSGSPVVNMRGEVVGVASAQILYGNRAQNINFCSAGEKVASLTPGRGYPLGKMDRPDWEVAEARKRAEAEERAKQQQEKYKVMTEIQKLSDQAYVKATAGDNDSAFRLYEQCLSMCRQISDNRCSANFLRNMGVVKARMGKAEEAQQFYKMATEELAKQ